MYMIEQRFFFPLNTLKTIEFLEAFYGKVNNVTTSLYLELDKLPSIIFWRDPKIHV